MPKTFLAFYLPGFRQDIQEVIAWSEDRFGGLAADRYTLLIRQALRDGLEEPTRPGAKARPDLAPHAFVYHLMFSRERVTGERAMAQPSSQRSVWNCHRNLGVGIAESNPSNS